MTDAIEVRSDVAPNGSYVVSIGVGPDEAWIVDRDQALAHAAATLDALARAEFDASVYRQLASLDVPTDAIGQLIRELRADRPPLDHATEPLMFEPGVSHSDQRAFLTIKLHGERIGQWEPEDARSHALACLEVVAAVELDAAYRRALVGVIGLDDQTARAVVDSLADHRLTPDSPGDAA